mmetsp:Transcript_10961/g.23441  ORF Transcript_10961/g.23441 Transcript_10961/m.23441 type:complete len:229 (-) Transcript_10961:1086-1772(-)
MVGEELHAVNPSDTQKLRGGEYDFVNCTHDFPTGHGVESSHRAEQRFVCTLPTLTGIHDPLTPQSLSEPQTRSAPYNAVQTSTISLALGMLLHPFSMFSKQQLFAPHPLEQIASDSTPGIFPGVALQHPRGQASATPDSQNPLGKHCPEHTPLRMHSVSLEHVFVHAHALLSSGANPSSHTIPAHGASVGVGVAVAVGKGVAVGVGVVVGVGVAVEKFPGPTGLHPTT